MPTEKFRSKKTTLNSLARDAGRTFGGMFIYLCPSVVAVPISVGVNFFRGGKNSGVQPGRVVANCVGFGVLLAAGAVAQKFVPTPSIAQIAAAYVATCGGLAAAGTAANMVVIGWTSE